jgi:hypothetical protein
MSQVIRYKVKPAFATENEELIRAVFDELHQANPAGFQYESYVQDDGVSFFRRPATPGHAWRGLPR